MIKYQGNKLGQIRNKYRQRLQMVGKIYIYLREGQSKNWTSLNLQATQLNQLSTLVGIENPGFGGGGESATNMQNYSPCAHCKAEIRGGGKQNCLWKNVSATESRRRAKLVLMQIENPGVLVAAVAEATD